MVALSGLELSGLARSGLDVCELDVSEDMTDGGAGNGLSRSRRSGTVESETR